MALHFAWNTVGRHHDLRIAESADPELFERVAAILARDLHGTWEERLNGFDQRYWDLRVGGGLVTLHLENYLGIMLFSSEPNQEKDSVPDILVHAKEVLSDHVPSA